MWLKLTSFRSFGQILTFVRRVHIAVPHHSNVDEPISLTVTGLKPKQQITISADATRNDVTLSSFANFQADSHHSVDVAKVASLGGSYVGLDPMGLFSSMDLTSSTKIVFKMVNGKVDNWPYVIRVFDGHVNNYEELRNRKPIAERKIFRLFLPKGVQRFDVRYKDVRAFLFMPKGHGPFPAIVDLFGGASGMVGHRGGILARHGYAVLTLAYAGYEDIPKILKRLDIGYFVRAVEYLKEHVPQVGGRHIGIHGSCLGGTLALALAREVPDISAVSVVSPEPVAGGWDYLLPSSGELKAAPWESVVFEKDGETYTHVDQKNALTGPGGPFDSWRKYSLQYGKIKAPILIFYGSEDKLFNFDFCLSALKEQFADENKQNYEIVLYNKAGHIIQPCYMPMFYRYYSPLFSSLVHYGGMLPYHSLAQVDMWHRTLHFFKSHLQEAHISDLSMPSKPVNLRRVNGKIVDCEDINCQHHVVDFDKQHSSWSFTPKP